MSGFDALGWVDWTLLAILALSVVAGLWRGLVFELMSLVGWVVAYLVAQAYAGAVAAHLPFGTAGSATEQAAGLAITFIAVLMAWSLLARLVRIALHATPLTMLDRTLGAGFGLLRGSMVLLVVANVVTFTPAARSQPWQQSHGAAWLTVALRGLKPMLPSELGRFLPE